jgi:hypothetical protein
MATHNNGPLIRTLRQISRNKSASPEVRVRCCELLVLIDPNISFNNLEKCNFPDLLAASGTRLNTSTQLRKTRQNGERGVEDEATGGDGWMVGKPLVK